MVLRGNCLFAVGHMALAYLLGKGSAAPLHVKVNVPLLLVVSILPDIDIIFQTLSGMELHRGITHSLLFSAALFVPIFLIYRKKAIPYFLALLSHAFIGDFLIGGGLQLLWPLQTGFGLTNFGGPNINIFSVTDEVAELSLFTAATALMVKTRDYRVFFRAHKTNLLLIIPTATVLLPPLIGYPLSQPLLQTYPPLAIAHLFYLALFVVAIALEIKTFAMFGRKNSKQTENSNQKIKD
jgi:membrane-bound metal-dependent hydrolase YbcI (DUF457 family)